MLFIYQNEIPTILLVYFYHQGVKQLDNINH